MIIKRKCEILNVHWDNYQKLKLSRGKWLVTTYYFLFIPVYRSYSQETFYA